MVDEKDMPTEKARCWMVNGTGRAVDVYVNYADVPYIDDVKPLSIGPELGIDGTADRPYGTYTFEVRPKDDPNGEVLASASVDLTEGDSYSAVLHRVGDFEYRLSIYRNDYSPSTDARFVVRHNSLHEEIDWRISQNGETPRIPDDPRSGTLGRGQWQEATDVTESDYLMEVFVDGEVVTIERDLELEIETTYVCYVVGDPGPLNIPSDNNYEAASDSGVDESKWILVQAFEVYPGGDETDSVGAPQEPVSVSDRNEPITFLYEPVEVTETNAVEAEVGATDPDGFVTGLSIDRVDPPTDGITIVDNSVDRAFAEGGTTTATLRVAADVPPDSYDVRIAANPESLGTEATVTVPVEVERTTVARQYDLVDRYQLSGDIDQPIATDLNALLDDAEAGIDAGETTAACATLKEFLDLLGANKGKGVSETALNDIQPETKALRKHLGCG
ncbi:MULTISPECIES: DUF4397 domain-containing protein [Halorussus]|uniref:DUF4397 domain-containing protein n=1 Tax=Halorussus TaxID=1070314 RepID=UPI00209E8E7E|nr:DUF4397 domain-containing protein [Halorussus vallis]USZ74461.1 DUF4397 domain-containing protein [Halorussus vallis]